MRRVVRSLNKSGLRYMLTGAMASNYYGRPRTTIDVDIVVAVKKRDLAKLTGALSDGGLEAVKERMEAGLGVKL